MSFIFLQLKVLFVHSWILSWSIGDDCLASEPMPEAAIDETVCRQRLLEHVEDYQQQVDDRLTSIQAQIAGKFIIAYKIKVLHRFKII